MNSKIIQSKMPNPRMKPPKKAHFASVSKISKRKPIKKTIASENLTAARLKKYLKELASAENNAYVSKLPDNLNETDIYTSCRDISFVKDMKLYKAPGDGNCLFHAVAIGVADKFETSAKHLRSMTVDFMKGNFDTLCNLFGFERAPFREHIAEMSRDGVYGEVYEVYCLSCLLNTTIKVVYGAECMSFFPNIYLTTQIDLPFSSVYLRLKDNHYDVYLPE